MLYRGLVPFPVTKTTTTSYYIIVAVKDPSLACTVAILLNAV